MAKSVRRRNIMIPRVNPSRKKKTQWNTTQSLDARMRVAQKGKLLSRYPYSLEEDGITQSLLGNYLDCPQEALFYLQGYRSLTTKASLLYGDLMHWFLELLANGIRAKSVVPKDGDDFFEHHIETWMGKKLKDSANDAQTLEFLAAQAKAVFGPYCLHWAKDDFLASRWLEVEGVFDTVWTGKLLGRPVRLRGKRDGLCRYKGKRSWIHRLREHKNHVQIPGWIDDALLIDFQNQFYLTAVNNDLDALGLKKPVREVDYNILRRPSQSLFKKGESLAEYTARVRVDIDERPDHYFKRIKLTYTAADLKRFAEDLERKIGSFADWLTHASPHCYERNERQCRGHYACSWMSACISGTMNEYRSDGRLFTELYE